ncbi:MAG: DUF1566 domain-containing protein [Flavobacteriaceae bacterium]|nr:DUF1566 domain-containing protein [Flavobacteriaceae bacterium]
MKKIYSLVAGLLLTASVFLPQQASAQAPQKMSYQAVIRNNSNALITSTPVGMKISILQGTASGTAVYVETQTPSTNANGLVSLEIGTGTSTGTFSAINWAAGPYFIKTETDPTGGTNYTIAGTNELMSVPYALFSANGTPGPAGAAGPQGPIGPIGPAGAAGTNGTNGTNGSSAYQIAIANGFVGTEAQWLASLKGEQGLQGLPGTNGTQGPAGPAGTNGAPGTPGTNGQGGVTTAGADIAIAGTGTVADPYVVSSKIYTIGLWPELGGYVFRISADGRHGLVAETQDQSTSSSWYLAQDAISNPSNHSTNGKKFMDWRLPTKYELNEMYLQNVAIGGFANDLYWSATEVGYTIVWEQNFFTGSQGSATKNGAFYVRAIRAF